MGCIISKTSTGTAVVAPSSEAPPTSSAVYPVSGEEANSKDATSAKPVSQVRIETEAGQKVKSEAATADEVKPESQSENSKAAQALQETKTEESKPEEASNLYVPVAQEPMQEVAPAPSNISLSKWVRLAVTWLCCTLAAGLIPGQAVFAAMFADAGVYAKVGCKEDDFPCDEQVAMLNMMFGAGMMVTMGLQIPNGLLFDLYGARVVGTAGSILVSVGLFFESIAIISALHGTDAATNWIVPVAALVTDFGSTLNSYCFFGLIWHYPGSTTLILSLSTATYQVSALLPLALQTLMSSAGINFGYAMLIFSLCVLLSAPVIWQLTPTQQDYLDQAKEVLGVPLPKPKVSFDLCNKMRKGWAAVRMDLRDHVFMVSGFAFSFVLASTYNSMSSAYGRRLFGSKDAGNRLAYMQVQATAIVGALCAPLVAKSADIIGLRLFAWVLTLFMIVPVLTFSIAEWWAAWVTTFGFCLFVTLNQLFMSRYFLHYSPPNRLGAYSAVFTMLMMVLMMPFGLGSYVYMMAMPEDSINQRYIVPYFVFGTLGVVSLIAFNIRFCFAHDGKGVPSLPNMLPEDEMELCAPFGAMNLEEAAEIVGLEREVLFKRLADPDPASLKAVMLLIDTDKMEAALDKHSAEDFITMMETAPEEEDDEENIEDGAELMASDSSSAPLLPSSSPAVQEAPTPSEEQAAARKYEAPHKLAMELRELFRPTGPGAEIRKSRLEGSGKEPDDQLRWRALGECLDAMVSDGDAEGCKIFMLEVPVDDQWGSFVGMEEWMDEKASKELEKKFNKLIPRKQFAALMKQNPRLKDLAARLMKREVQRTMNRFRGKK